MFARARPPVADHAPFKMNIHIIFRFWSPIRPMSRHSPSPSLIHLLCKTLLYYWLALERRYFAVTNRKASMKHLNFTHAPSLSSLAPYFTDSFKFAPTFIHKDKTITLTTKTSKLLILSGCYCYIFTQVLRYLYSLT